MSRLVVGLAVQWNPYYTNGLCADTLQLCVGTLCLIFQLSQATRVPLLLRRFLLHANNTFVGIWNGSDKRMLRLSKHELKVHRLLDLRRHVVSEDGESLARASVERIAKECLGYEGVRLDRDISMSAWDDEDLSYDQILQACVDAHVTFKMGKNYRAWEM